MRVRVVRTMKGSPDGITVNEYQAGQTYEMPSDLGEVFVREEWGVLDSGPLERPAVKPRETKPKTPAESPARKPAARKRSGKK